MKSHYGTILMVVLAAGCAQLPGTREYYPNLAFSNWQTHHNFHADWYASHLRAMHEPSFQAKLAANVALLERHRGEGNRPLLPSSYRFLYLPTFSEPILFRLDVAADGTTVLTTKRTNGKGGYGAGKLTFSKTTTVTATQLTRFRQLVKDLNPDKLPTTVDDMAGCDGSEWILEVVDGEVYHLVTRWCARQTGATEIGMIDDKGNESTVTLRDRIRENLPEFDVDAYFAGTKRLTELVDFMVTLSPLKNEKELEIY